MNNESKNILTIGLVTREPENKTSKRLIEEINGRSHQLVILEPEDVESALTCDGLIVRGSPSDAQQISTLLSTLTPKRIYATSTPMGWECSRNRQKTYDLLARQNLATPFTTSNYVTYIKKYDPPVVIKLSSSNQGRGVCIAESKRSAKSICDMLDVLKTPYVLQSYIDSPNATDERYFVVGDHVVAVMKRSGPTDDFRSNLSIGGKGKAAKPEPTKAALAIKAARSFGLDIAGVDIIESADGPLVLEINPSPGLGIEQATKTNIASIIVDWVEQQIQLLKR